MFRIIRTFRVLDKTAKKGKFLYKKGKELPQKMIFLNVRYCRPYLFRYGFFSRPYQYLRIGIDIGIDISIGIYNVASLIKN